ncbi:unnamed protein product [marine sediment metagenome]|uniref:Resolvase HTH domain-containing protein n=1 Tax=marine sediment metagenome TaxID=412755 RepID=X0ZLS5_9ZZZZ
MATESLEERAYRILGSPVRLTCREKIPREEVLKLMQLGYGATAIAKYFKVSRQTIYNILGKGHYQLLVGHFGEMRKNAERLKKRAIKDYTEQLGLS